MYITQAMGGKLTVYFDGNLVRVPGTDADALGKDPCCPPPCQPSDCTNSSRHRLGTSRTIYDPEIRSILSNSPGLRMHHPRLPNGERNVSIKMTGTALLAVHGRIMVDEARQKISIIPTVAHVDAELVFDPPWSQDMMSEAAQLEAGLM